MNNEKILNLTDVDTEDFETIKEAVEEWIDSGLPGKFTFVSEEETQECMEFLKEAFSKIYLKGALHGGLALIGGIATGALIHYTIEHFKAKKKVDE